MSQNERKRVEFYVRDNGDTAPVHRKVTKDLGGVTVVTSDVPISPDLETFRRTYPQVAVQGDRQKERSISELVAEMSAEELQAMGLERAKPSYPIKGSGGWWTLSDGNKVRGTEKYAKDEQSALDAEQNPPLGAPSELDEDELERLTAPAAQE